MTRRSKPPGSSCHRWPVFIEQLLGEHTILVDKDWCCWQFKHLYLYACILGFDSRWTKWAGNKIGCEPSESFVRCVARMLSTIYKRLNMTSPAHQHAHRCSCLPVGPIASVCVNEVSHWLKDNYYDKHLLRLEMVDKCCFPALRGSLIFGSGWVIRESPWD